MVHICMGGNLIFLVERYDLMKYGGKMHFQDLFHILTLSSVRGMQLSPKKMLSKSLILD